jgi:hypothetical protein
MFNSFHTVNQAALQNYGTGSEIDPHNKLYSFRAGNDTVCVGPPDDIFPDATLAPWTPGRRLPIRPSTTAGSEARSHLPLACPGFLE